MGTVLVFNPDTSGFEEVDENSLHGSYVQIVPFERDFLGVGPDPACLCIEQTAVNYDDVSGPLKGVLNEAYWSFNKFRYMSDALFVAGLFNLQSNDGTMVSSLFYGDNNQHVSFSNELVIIINQQERSSSLNFEMSTSFIRQLEDANIIRKARQSNKIQIADVLKAILYSRSSVGELMLRYGIDDAKITTCCRE